MALSHSFHVLSSSLVNMTNTRAVHLGFDNDIYLWNHAGSIPKQSPKLVGGHLIILKQILLTENQLESNSPK